MKMFLQYDRHDKKISPAGSPSPSLSLSTETGSPSSSLSPQDPQQQQHPMGMDHVHLDPYPNTPDLTRNPSDVSMLSQLTRRVSDCSTRHSKVPSPPCKSRAMIPDIPMPRPPSGKIPDNPIAALRRTSTSDTNGSNRSLRYSIPKPPSNITTTNSGESLAAAVSGNKKGNGGKSMEDSFNVLDCSGMTAEESQRDFSNSSLRVTRLEDSMSSIRRSSRNQLRPYHLRQQQQGRFSDQVNHQRRRMMMDNSDNRYRRGVGRDRGHDDDTYYDDDTYFDDNSRYYEDDRYYDDETYFDDRYYEQDDDYYHDGRRRRYSDRPGRHYYNTEDEYFDDSFVEDDYNRRGSGRMMASFDGRRFEDDDRYYQQGNDSFMSYSERDFHMNDSSNRCILRSSRDQQGDIAEAPTTCAPSGAVKSSGRPLVRSDRYGRETSRRGNRFDSFECSDRNRRTAGSIRRPSDAQRRPDRYGTRSRADHRRPSYHEKRFEPEPRRGSLLSEKQKEFGSGEAGGAAPGAFQVAQSRHSLTEKKLNDDLETVTIRKNRDNLPVSPAGNVKEDTVYIEVFPGVKERFLRLAETKEAIRNDKFTPTNCNACQLDVFCLTTVNYFICPECKCVCAFDGVGGCETRNGVGLAIRYETLFKMQAEIVKEDGKGR